MKKQISKSKLLLSAIFTFVGLVLFIFGFSAKNEDVMTLLILISPIITVVSAIITIVRSIKYMKQNGKAQIQPKQVAPIIKPEPAPKEEPATKETTNTPKEKKDIVIRESFELSDRIYTLYKTYTEVCIVGFQYHDIPNDLEYGETLYIKRVSNDYDDTGVGVFVSRNNESILIGFVSRNSKLYDMANDYIDKKHSVIIAALDNVEKMTFTMSFYNSELSPDSYLYYKDKKPIKTFSVTLNEEQGFSCEIGEHVYFNSFFDYFSVGFAEDKKTSASVAEFLQNYDKEVIAFVTESDEDYNFKTKAKIAIYDK